jgi:hypothetical protein
MNAMGPMTYCALNGMLDAGYPAGALNYWKSGFMSTLSDAAIDALATMYERCLGRFRIGRRSNPCSAGGDESRVAR